MVNQTENKFSVDGTKVPSTKEVIALIDNYVEEWKYDRIKGTTNLSPLFFMFVHYADMKWIEEQLEERGIVA